MDAAFENVQIFNKEGRILLYFGQGGKEPGNFMLPAKVAIDYDNLKYFEKYVQADFQVEYLILVTSQFGDRKVNVFAYGRRKERNTLPMKSFSSRSRSRERRSWKS